MKLQYRPKSKSGTIIFETPEEYYAFHYVMGSLLDCPCYGVTNGIAALSPPIMVKSYVDTLRQAYEDRDCSII